jgi:hypothetical protein
MKTKIGNPLACAMAAAMAGFLFAPPAATPQPNGTKSVWDDHPVNEWVKQSPKGGKPAPNFGWEGSGAYDPVSKLWIHQGGHDGVPQGFALFTYNLETGDWRQRFPNTSPPGACCVDGGNVFDVANGRFVRFPGASLGHGYQWSRSVKLKSSHVWLYDPAGNTWTNMRPPPYRFFANKEGLGSLNPGAAYDPVHELALSFGGQGNQGDMNNLFAYDAYANRLHPLTATNRPSPRDGMGLTYDPDTNGLITFGSQYASDEKTWIYRYETGAWQGHDLEPHPPGKKLGTYSTIPRMAYDTANRMVLCLTWDTKTNEHQTWTLDAAKMQWRKMDPKVEPAPSMSRSRNLSYIEEHNVFVLELSSKEAKGNGPQIWTYRYDKAPANKRTAAPADVQVVTHKDSATLSWKANAAPVKEYRIYRSQPEKPWQTKFERVGTTAGTTLQDVKLPAGKNYHYQVRAVGMDDAEGPPSFQARTQPRVALKPLVSVLGEGKVEVAWGKHPAADIIGYNVYRGTAIARAVKKGTSGAWKDNDPEYAEPVVVEVKDLVDVKKLNDQPLLDLKFFDGQATFKAEPAKADEYNYHVYAYIVTAVNRLGVESGPSPYALTIPSEPQNVLCREKGEMAELKWDANPEKGIAGYLVYKLGKGVFDIMRVTPEPIKATTFTHQAGRNPTRYWVVAVDALGQEGEPSSDVWANRSYKGFFEGEWHP